MQNDHLNWSLISAQPSDIILGINIMACACTNNIKHLFTFKV